MLSKTLCNKLSSTFLFRGVDLNIISKLCSSKAVEICHFKKDDIIYSKYDFKKNVGFVIEGTCEILRSSDGQNDVAINTISENGSFGILTVFSDRAEFPTTIKATRNTTIAFIDKPTVLALTKKNTTIAMNVIAFMSERISFLNERLNTFSGSTVEEKLASYLIFLSKSAGSMSFVFSKAKAAEAIGAGRASVYRAITGLADKGMISLNGKIIIIIDPLGLERISK